MAMLSKRDAEKLGLIDSVGVAKGMEAGPTSKRRKNKTERAYGEYLEMFRQAGKIRWYEFEAIKFRLADNTYYTPDYAVMRSDRVMEIHEVKGYWRDDGRVKIKVAASLFPFYFLAVQKAKSGWKYEAITKDGSSPFITH